jgi:hypothetical protein
MTTINQKCYEYLDLFIRKKWRYENTDPDELYDQLIGDLENTDNFAKWFEKEDCKFDTKDCVTMVKKVAINLPSLRSLYAYKYSDIMSKYAKEFFENSKTPVSNVINRLDCEWRTRVQNLKNEFDELMLINPEFKKWVLTENSLTTRGSFGLAETCAIGELTFENIKFIFESTLLTPIVEQWKQMVLEFVFDDENLTDSYFKVTDDTLTKFFGKKRMRLFIGLSRFDKESVINELGDKGFYVVKFLDGCFRLEVKKHQMLLDDNKDDSNYEYHPSRTSVRLENIRSAESESIKRALLEIIDSFFEISYIDTDVVIFKYSELKAYLSQFTFDSRSIVNENGKFIDDGSVFIARTEDLRYRSLLESSVDLYPDSTGVIIELEIGQCEKKEMYYYETGGLMFAYVTGCIIEPIDPTVNILVFNEHLVIDVADNMFEKFNNLTHVIFGKHIMKIGDNAFKGCSNLVSVVLSKSCSIATNTFDGCPKLQIKNY